MTTTLLELQPEEAGLIPIDQLALLVLQHLSSTEEWNEHNFINRGDVDGVPRNVLRYWAEALNWLISKNLVARGTPGQASAQAIFITRLGQKVLVEGVETIRAAERLDMDLHDRLSKVRSQFLIGEYEIAAFAAMREVEIRVRELSGASSSLLGVKLINATSLS